MPLMPASIRIVCWSSFLPSLDSGYCHHQQDRFSTVFAPLGQMLQGQRSMRGACEPSPARLSLCLGCQGAGGQLSGCGFCMGDGPCFPSKHLLCRILWTYEGASDTGQPKHCKCPPPPYFHTRMKTRGASSRVHCCIPSA